MNLKPHISLGVLLLIGTTWIGCGRPDASKNDKNQSAGTVVGSNLQDYKYSELHKVEDFELTERDGSRFGTKDLKGKVWLVSFFFSTCKFECSDQNRTIRDEVHEKLAGTDLVIVSITCDPANDTPDVLKKYATEFTTVPEKWKFLTGPLLDVQAIGNRSFKVVVEPTSHSKRLLLVDKWGRFRDSFEWKEPEDLIRLRKVVRMLEAESAEPDPDTIVKTRALPESVFQLNPEHPTKPAADGQTKTDSSSSPQRDPNWPSWRNEEWLTSFELTDANGKPFHSRDLLGKVWVANFFFTSCTGACPRLLGEIQELRKQLGDRDITFVSISNDPERDAPGVLKDYARRYDVDTSKDNRWIFLTGKESLQIRAIGAEFFDVNAGSGESHSEQLTVVDKWGKVRGHFYYNKPEEMKQMRILLDDLLAEQKPPKAK